MTNGRPLRGEFDASFFFHSLDRAVEFLIRGLWMPVARFTFCAQKDSILLIRVDASHSNCGHQMATVGRKLMSFRRGPKYSSQFVMTLVATSPFDLCLMLYSFQFVTFLEIHMFRYCKMHGLLSFYLPFKYIPYTLWSFDSKHCSQQQFEANRQFDPWEHSSWFPCRILYWEEGWMLPLLVV